MDVPDRLAPWIGPIFEAVPLDVAMPELVEPKPNPRLTSLVEACGHLPPSLTAGLWLYADDLERSHAICQADPSPTGSMWHAILHRREGDFWNSKYWLRQAGAHPAFVGWSGYDPARFVDQVQSGSDPGTLLQMQREEWRRLFEWCLRTEARP